MQNIMVSVCCLAYNQRNFIREALNSILVQKTLFPFEIIIHDDASTDGTAEIIREYEAEYPEIVRPIYQQKNQFSQNGIYPLAFVYPQTRGKYIALCDGDDYWTDPLKLQKQVNFMEVNPEYALCHHAYLIYDNGAYRIPHKEPPRDYSADELIGYTEYGYGIATSTKLYKNLYHESDKGKRDFEDFIGDYMLNVMLGMYGPGKYVPDIAPSIYRRSHGKNSWSELSPSEKIMRTKKMRRNLHELMLARGNAHWAKLREGLL